MQDMNWNDLRYVLTIARAGTLAAAARRLAVNETTVARRLRAAERALGVRLLDRIDGVFRPTQAGEVLLTHAERVERELGVLATTIAGADAIPAGTVRLTSVPLIVNRLLVPALPGFYARYPLVRLELIAEPRNLSLTRREADVALRLARPTAGAALTRRLGRLDYAVFASRRRDPDKLPWISYGDDFAQLSQAQWIANRTRDGEPPRLLVNDAEGILAAICAGLGKSLLPTFLAAEEPRLRLVGGPAPVLSRDIWLLVHRELRPLARIAAVIAWLEQVVAGATGGPEPAGRPTPRAQRTVAASTRRS